ncbi:ribonuclease H-like domain-containing protein [Tanacetum coccineum]|uniref:Ribonuclease H-like domain-containing protein n=1 Tax=Tanacetum coccineum TaxID=301880 RepID=A0ABQ5EJX1_9ASTR
MVNKLGHKIIPSENRTRRFFVEPNLLGLKRLQGFLELLLLSFALRNFDLEDMEFESANSNTTAIDEDTYSKAMLAIDGVDDLLRKIHETLCKEQVSKDTISFVESSLNVDKVNCFSVDKGELKKLEWQKVNYNYTTKRNHPNAQRNMVLRAVLMKTGLKTFYTARTVNTAHLKSTVFSAKPMLCFLKIAQSTVRRPFQSKTSLSNKRFTHKVNNAKAQAVNTARPQAVNTARPKIVKTARPNTAVGKPQQDDTGFVDIGCSRHMTGNIAYLSDFKEFDGGYVTFGGGAHGGTISGKGTVKTDSLDFEDVYFVNELKFNLFSVSQMCDKKNYVLFTDIECLVLSPNLKLPDESQILLKIPRKDNMYSFDMKNIVPKETLTCLVAKATSDESMLWHRRLGHINFKNINKLVKDNLVRGLPTKRFENEQTYVACLKGKQHRDSCKSKVLNLITKPLFMLHMDLEKGIKREYSVAKTPQQNGVAKRRNMTLIEAARTMLADSKLPTIFWAEAVYTACYLGKFDGKVMKVSLIGYSLSSKLLGYTKLEPEDGDGPDNENDEQDKSDDVSSPKEVNAVGQHVTTASSTLEATHVEFSNDEDEPKVDLGNITNSYTVPTSPNTRIHKDHPIENVIGDVKTSVQTRRMTKPTSEQGFLSAVYEQKTHDTLNTCLYACFLSQIEPTSIAKALSDSSWVEAMQEELLQFKLQQVWILVDLPIGKRAIGTKWVFRNKKDERGIVIRNKARLVAQGHRQEEGIDYEEVFAPVARIEAIRLFLAYASFMGFLVYQMDVKSAFLYRTIEEEVYLTQPLGFKDPDNPDKVYKVVKQKEDGIFISQDKYVDEILKKFNYIDVKSASTLVDLEKPLVKYGDADDVDVHLYRSMIGSLMYLTSSRLDIMFAYSRDSPFELVAYTDSDYARATQDRKFTTGGCQFLGNMLISWQCKKQTVVATFTTEAKYVVVASCCGQVWIQNQLLDYGYNFMHTVIHIDNNNLLTKGFDAGRFRHLRIRFRFRCANQIQIQGLLINKQHYGLTPAGKKLLLPGKSYYCWAQKLQLLSRFLSLEALFEGRLLIYTIKAWMEGYVGDEVVHKELGDRTERAATTASSLEAEQDSGSGPRCQDTILGDVDAQTRFETTSKQSNDPPLSRGYTLRSGKDSLKLLELMKLCTTVKFVA